MDGLIANLWSVHLIVWAFAGGIGLLIGAYMSQRGVALGTVILITLILTWSFFIGLIPILNHAISPDGLAGIFAVRGFAEFLVEAAPQAILSEPWFHRMEVLQGAGIGAAVFAVACILTTIVIQGRAND